MTISNKKIDQAVKALIFIESFKSSNGGNTPNDEEIAEHLGLKTEYPARGIVDILEKSGLIEVVRGKGGRRRWIIVKGAEYRKTGLVSGVSSGEMITAARKLGRSPTDNDVGNIISTRIRKELLSGLE